jgi:hypothetical protein
MSCILLTNPESPCTLLIIPEFLDTLEVLYPAHNTCNSVTLLTRPGSLVTLLKNIWNKYLKVLAPCSQYLEVLAP